VDGTCVATTPEDCEKSYDCRNNGRCTPQGNKCMVMNDGDCRRSAQCKQGRKCKERGGRCVKE
jgi:hypothetical protein